MISDQRFVSKDENIKRLKQRSRASLLAVLKTNLYFRTLLTDTGHEVEGDAPYQEEDWREKIEREYDAYWIGYADKHIDLVTSLYTDGGKRNAEDSVAICTVLGALVIGREALILPAGFETSDAWQTLEHVLADATVCRCELDDVKAARDALASIEGELSNKYGCWRD